ncbi:MAG: flagellar basal body rod protein FlgB [Myxococcales bacterium]|nr:MAG: flagellar basal body rod protein FlgB [Myxococcales bacterium]
MKLFDTIEQALQRNMDLRLTRQSIINANIANADTPGYRPVTFNFEQQLAEAVKEEEGGIVATDAGHLAPAHEFAQIEGDMVEQAGELSPDGNAVDIDRQMADLGSNSFNYQASAKMVSKKMAILRYVINQVR